MLVTITGAYKNAGDYLIGLRARALLEKYVDKDIVNIDRKQPIDYQFLNTAKAVVLTGGPALQPGIYPAVYDLDLEKITVPVVGFGLGWKASLGKKPAEFEFTESSLGFLEKLKPSLFSVRDQQSFKLLDSLGFEKLSMTGCPAWYDLEKIDQDFSLPSSISSVVLSTPAVPNKQLIGIAKLINKKYPKAKKTLLFQAGFKSTHSTKSYEYTKQLRRVSMRLRLSGWQRVSSEGNAQKMMEILSSADLHIGYRVHSHLYSLSQRKPSLLIAEDARGEAQNKTLGLQSLSTQSPIADIEECLSLVVREAGSMQPTVELMQDTFEEMKVFLEKLKAL